MTFYRNREGEWVERNVTIKSVAKVVFNATTDIIEAHARLFHVIIELIVKIGLISFLYPWIKLFLVQFYTTLGALPPHLSVPLH